MTLLQRQEERMNRIVQDFAQFLETDKPLIPDAGWLPYTRQVIHEALRWKVHQLCDLGNSYLEQNIEDELPAIEKHLEMIQGVRVFLITYSTVDPEDKKRVDYFKNYKAIADVPTNENEEFSRLLHKYMSRAWHAMDEPD